MLNQIHRVLKPRGLYLSQGNPSDLGKDGPKRQKKYFDMFGLIETQPRLLAYRKIFRNSLLGNMTYIPVGNNSVMISRRKHPMDLEQFVLCPFCDIPLDGELICGGCGNKPLYSYPDNATLSPGDRRRTLLWDQDVIVYIYDREVGGLRMPTPDMDVPLSHGSYMENCKGVCLDIGCGTGYPILSIAKAGFISQAVGIGISPKAIKDAICLREKHKLTKQVEFICTPLEKYYTGELFDSIVVKDTFEHMFSPLWTLDKICELLKPDGVLVGAVPGGKCFDNIAHLHFFSKELIKEFLEYRFEEVVITIYVEKHGPHYEFVCKGIKKRGNNVT